MNWVFPLIVFTLVFPIRAIVRRWQLARGSSSDRLIRSWASSNNVVVVLYSARILRRGPFSFCSSAEQYVYYIEGTRAGETVSLWVCIGPVLGGSPEPLRHVRTESSAS